MLERTADLRARAAQMTDIALHQARAAATLAAQRVEGLKGSFALIKAAGRDLNLVARRHVGRFVDENRTIAVEAGKDLKAFARSTYATFTNKPAPAVRKARKAPAKRKRAAARAA
jgi:hypothetical protein